MLLTRLPSIPTSLPLVIDLDGTLIRTDTFHEMMAQLLVKKPWVLFQLPFWFLKGRPFTKARLAQQIDLSPEHLPYNLPFLTFAKNEAQKGRPLILATGTNQEVAQKIANHLGIFQEVIGSDENINMTGPHKQQALLKRFSVQGFDYAGDSRIDKHVWQVARFALVVHPKRGVLKCAQAIKGAENILYFPREKTRGWALLQALYPLFWVFNLFAPSWSLFIALSLLTSGLFIMDNLLTLSQERTGLPPKSVFAEGHLHLITAFILAPLLILPALFFIVFSLPLGIFFILLYIPLFIGLDIFTHSFTQNFRSILLGLFQLLAVLTLSICVFFLMES